MRRRDPLEAEIENALQPGNFIPDRAVFSFVRDLEGVAKEIAGLSRTDPGRAIRLFEAFLAGCHAKAEETDDSCGALGDFVCELCGGWIRARQAADADPRATVSKLLEWMDDDPYGFFSDIEAEAFGVLDKAGSECLEGEMRARFEANDAAAKGGRPEYHRGRWAGALRALYLRRKDLASYVAITEKSGLTGEDCHAVATLLGSRGRHGEALAWVERGLKLDKDDYDLAALKRRLVTKLGRGGEALEDAWAEYNRHPDWDSYRELMKFVPKKDRNSWHEKAMDAARGRDLFSFFELFIRTKEQGRLAELVQGSTDGALEKESHYTLEPAAKKLGQSHPALAARLWRAQGMRILKAKKSKYYDAALQNLEQAMLCYQKANLASGWEKTVRQIRVEHHRKGGFMPGFEALVAGRGPSKRPTFLEAAKRRWKLT